MAEASRVGGPESWQAWEEGAGLGQGQRWREQPPSDFLPSSITLAWAGLCSELIPAHLEALTNQIAPVTPLVCHSVLRLPSVSFKSLAVFVFYSCPDFNSPGSTVPSIRLGNAQDRGTSSSRSGAS